MTLYELSPTFYRKKLCNIQYSVSLSTCCLKNVYIMSFNYELLCKNNYPFTFKWGFLKSF